MNTEKNISKIRETIEKHASNAAREEAARTESEIREKLKQGILLSDIFVVDFMDGTPRTAKTRQELLDLFPRAEVPDGPICFLVPLWQRKS